ncbi:c-type cytochrome [Alkalihalobacillus oceani]|uniref:c-type cytochrome n=1 Tax=Halalkalibacter oceani TaxID=1653776 RepID=UPI00203DEA3F|nr:c-type cytochrome [Halalkalibacter oceani]MCM3760663.1 c-type cytochrome [Halalkalibacter oceani]
MKKFLLVLGAVFALTACGGGGEEPAPVDEAPVDEAPADDAAGEEAAGDFDAEAARTSYEASCIGCHGGNLQGGAGPALAGTELSVEEIEDVILNGQGTMPAQNIPQEDANNIAQWIKTQ